MSLVVVSTSLGMTSDSPGNSRTSSYVRPIMPNFAGIPVELSSMKQSYRSGHRHQTCTSGLSASPNFTARRLDSASEWAEVRAVLDCLADGDREALLLFAWEELTYPQIAAATGIPARFFGHIESPTRSSSACVTIQNAARTGPASASRFGPSCSKRRSSIPLHSSPADAESPALPREESGTFRLIRIS